MVTAAAAQRPPRRILDISLTPLHISTAIYPCINCYRISRVCRINSLLNSLPAVKNSPRSRQKFPAPVPFLGAQTR